MIRLSEALARVHLDTEIRKVYVEEVCRLMRVSNIERVHADIQLGVTSQIAIDTNKEDRIRQLVSFSY
jgi:DNA replicative helicase MCM subunit Mcm2 (Cdc46/Mcm family)